MNKLAVLLLFTNTLFAQVGIETLNPSATLDVNGTFRIRSISQETDIDVINDSILVISKSGNVNRVNGKDIVNSALPSMVKATFSSSGNVNHLLSLGAAKLNFDNELVDYNNEYDASSNTFTAKQDGIYAINAQVKISSLISVSTNFGLGIYKNNVLISEQSYLNISLLGVNVSSPIRYISTTIDLLENDTITFKVTSTLLNVNILGNSTDSYCAIYQLR